MAPDPPLPAGVDPAFLDEWIEFGWSELISYLTKWAAFDRWLETHPPLEEEA